ncbi:MAG: ATP-binding cassette domain-containing protein [Planctomycetes bacterium]|nr:ATP-binding cassette domain-containing protein [Planctomycetota bacterium]
MTLTVSDISFAYPKEKPVLSGVSVNVEAEEMVVLAGPSGQGKSTLLHCIAGLLTPTSGKIYVDGVDVTRKKPHERSIGIMMQDQPLYEHLSVSQNLEFLLRTRGMKKDVSMLLEQLELASIARKKVIKCSGGERRRIAFGRAVVLKPRVLLLDEPFVSLNHELREILLSAIRNLNIPTLLVTHDTDRLQGDRELTLEEL